MNQAGINKNYIKQLYTILKDEHNIYESILNIEEEKHNLLMKGIFTNLEPINQKLEDSVKKSVNIEQKRIAVSKFVMRELNLPYDSTLKKIIKELPDEFKDKFNEILLNLNKILEEIHRINDINSRLIQDTLRIIDVSLGAYTDEKSSIEIDYSSEIRGKSRNNSCKSGSRLFNKII